MVLSSTILYFSYALLLRFWGRRLRASLSVFSVAVVTVAGSITARAMLGNIPTLTGGFIALIVIFSWEAIARHPKIRPLFKFKLASTQAELVMLEGVILTDQLKTFRLSEEVLWTKLRQAGITHRNQVALGLLESNGQLTILRSGNTIDSALLASITGRERIPDYLIDRPETNT